MKSNEYINELDHNLTSQIGFANSQHYSWRMATD